MLLDQAVDFSSAPRLLLLMRTIKPNAVDPTIMGTQFANLAVEIADVFCPVRSLILRDSRKVLERAGKMNKVRMVPIGLGVVQRDSHTAPMASLDQLADQVPFEGRLRDVEVRQGTIEKAKAIVVLGCQADVTASCFFSQVNPIVGVEMVRIELILQF